MRKSLFGLILLAFLATPSAVRADVAPPAQPSGSNPQPGVETTEVRMVAETVTIEIQEKTPDDSLGVAQVTANFNMHNQGEQDESMAVRFPTGASDGYGNVPEITDMRIKVNGVSVPLRVIDGEDPNGFADQVPWVEFDVSFPAGKDVNIQAAYTLEGEGELPFISFSYIFSTGAGWKGTIGNAAIYVRFPYEISELNVLPNTSAYGENIFPDHQLSGTELKWSRTDFEPEKGDNFIVQIVAPESWQDVLLEQKNTVKKPSDGEAWGRLAKKYKELAFSSRRRGFRTDSITADHGARSLYTLSVESYEKATKLRPYDPLWHAGFADLLAYYSYYAGFEGIYTQIEAFRAMQEIQIALERAPDDYRVLEIAEEMTYYLNGGMVKTDNGFEFPWLTATPLPSTPTMLPIIESATPEPPTQTPIIETQTEVPSTPAESGTPLCGSVFVIPLSLFLLLLFTKKPTALF